MRDILAGGILRTHEGVCGPRRKALPRRRRIDQNRPGFQTAPVPPKAAVQPGQLASPLMLFGFPSLAVH